LPYLCAIIVEWISKAQKTFLALSNAAEKSARFNGDTKKKKVAFGRFT
jgi:hypothetical protein